MIIITDPSRAQHGMYIIGDSKCASNVEMWHQVISILRQRDQIGAFLSLRCPRHENLPLKIATPSDFEALAPEGGCATPCGQQLDCGHPCELKCHAEIRHRTEPCQKPCTKTHPCGHVCTNRCSEPCGKCKVLKRDVPLACGHTLTTVQCWITCDLTVPEAKCRTRVTRRLLECHHEAEMWCWENPSEFKCRNECGGILECQHERCVNPCFSCVFTGDDATRCHAPCKQRCNKDLKSCCHRCPRACHQLSTDNNCGPCNGECQFSCSHGTRRTKCGQPCVPCTEPCSWSCEHMGQCGMPCGALCDRLPCGRRCARLLDCGHRCPSICGEVCPSSLYCQVCGTFKHKDIRVETTIDSVQFTTYEQIDLDENPVVVLPCQHFFSRRFVDVMLNIMAVYASDEHGQFVRVITPSQMIVQLKQCPDCRQLISGLHRYNRILKRAVLDISLKEVVSRYQLMYTEISEKFDDFETRLQNSRPAILNKILHIRDPRKIRPVTMHNMNLITQRIKSFSEIESQIQQYKHRVEEQIQPDMGLSFSAMSHVKDTGIERSTETHPLDVPMPQIKYQLTAHILELRLSAMLNDDITGLLPTFLSRGCEKEANRLYEEAAKQCKLSYEKGIKYKSECDRRRYWGHGVEIMLLQVQFISLIFRASTHTSAASTMPLQELGMTILHSCITYLRKYPPCQKYENAIHRLHCVFSGESLGESLHQTLSIDERKAIIRAMNAGLEGSGPWYQCSNDHPVPLYS